MTKMRFVNVPKFPAVGSNTSIKLPQFDVAFHKIMFYLIIPTLNERYFENMFKTIGHVVTT